MFDLLRPPFAPAHFGLRRQRSGSNTTIKAPNQQLSARKTLLKPNEKQPLSRAKRAVALSRTKRWAGKVYPRTKRAVALSRTKRWAGKAYPRAKRATALSRTKRWAGKAYPRAKRAAALSGTKRWAGKAYSRAKRAVASGVRGWPSARCSRRARSSRCSSLSCRRAWMKSV